MKICSISIESDNGNPLEIGDIYQRDKEGNHFKSLYLCCQIKRKIYLISLENGYPWTSDGQLTDEGFTNVTETYCVKRVD